MALEEEKMGIAQTLVLILLTLRFSRSTQKGSFDVHKA